MDLKTLINDVEMPTAAAASAAAASAAGVTDNVVHPSNVKWYDVCRTKIDIVSQVADLACNKHNYSIVPLLGSVYKFAMEKEHEDASYTTVEIFVLRNGHVQQRGFDLLGKRLMKMSPESRSDLEGVTRDMESVASYLFGDRLVRRVIVTVSVYEEGHIAYLLDVTVCDDPDNNNNTDEFATLPYSRRVQLLSEALQKVIQQRDQQQQPQQRPSLFLEVAQSVNPKLASQVCTKYPIVGIPDAPQNQKRIRPRFYAPPLYTPSTYAVVGSANLIKSKNVAVPWTSIDETNYEDVKNNEDMIVLLNHHLRDEDRAAMKTPSSLIETMDRVLRERILPDLSDGKVQCPFVMGVYLLAGRCDTITRRLRVVGAVEQSLASLPDTGDDDSWVVPASSVPDDIVPTFISSPAITNVRFLKPAHRYLVHLNHTIKVSSRASFSSTSSTNLPLPLVKKTHIIVFDDDYDADVQKINVCGRPSLMGCTNIELMQELDERQSGLASTSSIAARGVKRSGGASTSNSSKSSNGSAMKKLKRGTTVEMSDVSDEEQVDVVNVVDDEEEY